MKSKLLIAFAYAGLLAFQAGAATLTVTTANNINPPTGAVSLKQALTQVQDGDTIAFNIPGPGPHYIETPPGGYPLITNNNVTINGYSQPGSAPNTNPILAANNAQIKIVLDSRNANHTLMDYEGTTPNDDTGYGDGEGATLGILRAQGVVIRGIAIISAPLGQNPAGEEVSIYGVSFAMGASGRISGCWIGVDVNGTSLYGPADGITGFRYRERDENNTVTQTILVQNVVVGVPVDSTNAPADFNVIVGVPAIPIILEGENNRISGNFLGVFPDGMRDFNPAFDPVLTGFFEGHIEIGRAGNNTVIGVDGDGVNDANERNIFGGVARPEEGGYDHTIEFYGQTPGTNIVIAGNYFGVAVDGTTRFTNGVPAVGIGGGGSVYRFGSDFDGVSDALEGNLVFNNWPTAQYATTGGERFLNDLQPTATASVRGNSLINNFAFPVSPLAMSGESTFLDVYYSRALVDVANGVFPTISSNSTTTKLAGTVPVANAEYPTTIIDLYVADPEGIAYGLSSGVPELTNGYVQGRIYIGSFVEGSAADKNAAAGAFEFDLTGVTMPGNLLTITANYAQPAVGTNDPVTLTSPFSPPVTVREGDGGPRLNITRTATGATISWTADGYVLQRTTALPGGWVTVPTTGKSYVVTGDETAFFRLTRAN